MRFDFIIGNPPYSDRTNADCGGSGGVGNNLDSDIFTKSMEHADRVSFIIRAKHFIREPSNFRRSLFSSGHLESIVYVHPSNFPQVQNTQTCIVTWDKDCYSACNVTYSDGEVLQRVLTKDTLIKLDNKEFELSVPNNMKHRHCYGKLSRNRIVDVEGGVPLVEIMGKKGDPVCIRRINPQVTNCGYGKHGVVMNFNSSWESLGKICLKHPDWRISGSIVMLETSSYEESERLLRYLATIDVSKIKRSFSNSKYVFALITDLD